jgi:hypothetical protein
VFVFHAVQSMPKLMTGAERESIVRAQGRRFAGGTNTLPMERELTARSAEGAENLESATEGYFDCKK